MSKKGLVGAIITGLAIVGGLTICTEKIPAGYVGVVYNMNGGVTDEVLTQGFHVISPIKKVTEYSIAIEQGYLSKDEREGSKDDDSFNIPTSDGKTINVDLEYLYHFDQEKLSDTFTQFKGQDGTHIEETFIRGKLKAWAGEVSSTFSVIDVFGDKRAELNTAVKEHVSKQFEPYGIIIDTINFTRVETDAQTDAETRAAIQKKVNAQQELELSKIELETAKVQVQ